MFSLGRITYSGELRDSVVHMIATEAVTQEFEFGDITILKFKVTILLASDIIMHTITEALDGDVMVYVRRQFQPFSPLFHPNLIIYSLVPVMFCPFAPIFIMAVPTGTYTPIPVTEVLSYSVSESIIMSQS